MTAILTIILIYAVSVLAHMILEFFSANFETGEFIKSKYKFYPVINTVTIIIYFVVGIVKRL